MSEPENLVLTLLCEMRGEMGDVRQQMSTKKDLADVRNDIAAVNSDLKSLRADVASDLISMEKRLSDRIAHLNRAVMEYHSSTIGHGVLFSEFEERLRRVEQYLKLPPTESH